MIITKYTTYDNGFSMEDGEQSEEEVINYIKQIIKMAKEGIHKVIIIQIDSLGEKRMAGTRFMMAGNPDEPFWTLEMPKREGRE